MNKSIVLAGGCFWGIEELFRIQRGVVSTRVGYTGGSQKFPKYEDVKTGTTNHAEAIEIIFDDSLCSLSDILDFFFKIHDPTTHNRQGNDIGSQYRSAIFYADEAEKELAQEKISRLEKEKKWPGPIITTLEKLSEFFPAEEVHQKYLMKNPAGYTCHFIRED